MAAIFPCPKVKDTSVSWQKIAVDVGHYIPHVQGIKSQHYMYRLSKNNALVLWPRRNGRHFVDDLFKCIFLNENIWISTNISLKFVPKGPINNIPALIQIIAWRRPGDKPLSESMMVRLPTHICITRPQWVNRIPVLTVNWYNKFEKR